MKQRKPRNRPLDGGLGLWFGLAWFEREKCEIKIGKNSVIIASETLNHFLCENLLFSIHFMFKKNKMNLKDAQTLIIGKGPGSFTSIRVSVAIANALSFALNIPLIALSREEWECLETSLQSFSNKSFLKPPVFPIYSHPPAITARKY